MESEKTCDHYDHYDYTDDVKDIHWFMLPLKNVSLVLRQRGCVHVNDTIAWSRALGVRHAANGVLRVAFWWRSLIHWIRKLRDRRHFPLVSAVFAGSG